MFPVMPSSKIIKIVPRHWTKWQRELKKSFNIVSSWAAGPYG